MFDRCLTHERLGGRHVGGRQIKPIQEVGRHQHADQGVANSFVMGQLVLGPKRLVIGDQVGGFGFCERPAVGAFGEVEQRLQMLRLGIGALFLKIPQGGVDAVEVIANGEWQQQDHSWDRQQLSQGRHRAWPG